MTLLVLNSALFASEIQDNQILKNKLYNFTSKKINEDMGTSWNLTGLFIEKYVSNLSFIKNPKLKLFNEGLITNISSDTAIDPTGEMEEIYLENNVTINRNSFKNNDVVKLYTSYAIFYLSKNIVETDRGVTIITSDSTTTGNGMSANLDEGVITILSDVKRIVKKDNQLQTINGNQMIYNTKTREWIVKKTPAENLKNTIKGKVSTQFNLE